MSGLDLKVEEFLVHVSEWRQEGDTGGGDSVTILVSEGAMVRVLDDGKLWRDHIRVLLIVFIARVRDNYG